MLAFTIVLPVSALAGVGAACTVADRVHTSEGPTTDVLICDAGTMTLKTARSLKTNPVREGIATATPQATLDVNGEIKVGNTGALCTATERGALRSNGVGTTIEVCDGTAWAAIGGGAPAPGGNGEIVFNSSGLLGTDVGFKITAAGDVFVPQALALGQVTGASTPPARGTIKLQLNSAAPMTCNAAAHGSLAMTSTGTMCTCTTANAWRKPDGTTACSW